MFLTDVDSKGIETGLAHFLPEQLIPASIQLIPASIQLIPASIQLIPASIQLIPASIQLIPASIQLTLNDPAITKSLIMQYHNIYSIYFSKK